MARRSRPLDDPNHPRRRLLAAAAAAFGDRGYRGATLQEIAAAAGLPKSAIFYYFPNKQAMLLAISLEIHARLRAQFDEVEQRCLRPDEALEALIAGHVHVVIEHFPATRVLLHEIPPEMAGLEEITAARARYRGRLQAVIERGIAEGIFAPIEPWLATEALLGMVAYSLAERYTPSWPLDVATLADRYARMAVHALQSSASPAREGRFDRRPSEHRAMPAPP